MADEKRELKACPFCGGKNLKVERCGTDDECTFIHCNTCEAGGPTSTPRGETTAQDDWNTRPEPAIGAEALEKARDLLQLVSESMNRELDKDDRWSLKFLVDKSIALLAPHGKG